MVGAPIYKSKLILPISYYCLTKSEKVDEKIEYEPGQFKDAFKYVDKLDLERMKDYPKYVIEEFEKRLKINDLQYNRHYLEDIDVVLNRFLEDNVGKINAIKILFTQSSSPDGDIHRAALVLYELLEAIN